MKTSTAKKLENVTLPVPKPFAKWAGGKSQLLEQYEPLFPETFHAYHEPFLGGGAAFLHLAHSRPRDAFGPAILSDANADLVSAWQAIRDQPSELIAHLREHAAAYAKAPKQYYARVRAQHAPTTYLQEAARFIFLNRTCFNGLYRVNRKGEFNVPIGRYKNPRICDAENIYTLSELLSRFVPVGKRDFSSILVGHRPPLADDFVYLDPPYLPMDDTADFTKYTADGFTYDDHIRLRDFCRELDERKVKFMLSNSDTFASWQLYGKDGFNIVRVRARRNVNSKGDKRGEINELVIRNYDS